MLVWLFAPHQIGLDRFINLCLILLAGATVYRLTPLVRAALLWRVSRKLVLSYILVGAVPILLLVTFSVLAFVLIFSDVSAYLVQSRVAALTAQATTIARSAATDAERATESQYGALAERWRRASAAEHPGASISVARREDLPAWLRESDSSGIVVRGGATSALAVVPVAPAGRHVVLVELPVLTSIGRGELVSAGIDLAGRGRSPYSFTTATFLGHRDWETGRSGRTPVALSVDVPVLYRFLGRSQDQGASASLNQLLLYALIVIGALLLVIEIVALASGLGLARSITAAVDELFSGTERVAAGEFGRPIAVRSQDQLGHLTASFNEMTARIEALLREQDEQRRLAEELRIARDIQMSLLPQGPLDALGLSVAALCAPAREVGGDYYDFLPRPDGQLGLLVADVSGKGMSAALYMAELKGLMLSLSRIHSSPRALLIEANRIMADHLDSRSFITMTYAVFDLAAGTLTCARAGHCPFIRVPAGIDGLQPAQVIAPDGMVLGLNIDRGEHFDRCLEEVTIPVNPGDLFFFFTDGVSEAMIGAGDLFGDTRIAAFLEGHAAHTPEVIREALVGELAAFAKGQPQHDDVTMIIVKIDG